MRLSGRVMGVLKGIGGAAVIASAVGCAASQPEPVTPVVRTPVILTQVEVEETPVTTVVVKPDPVEPEEVPVEIVEPVFPDHPDIHPACGRG
jgi:hypothetical protein